MEIILMDWSPLHHLPSCCYVSRTLPRNLLQLCKYSVGMNIGSDRDVMSCVSNMSFIMAEIGLRRINQKTKHEALSVIIPISHRHCWCWTCIQPHNQTVKRLQSLDYSHSLCLSLLFLFRMTKCYGTWGPGMTVPSDHSAYISASICLNPEWLRGIINFSAFTNHKLSIRAEYRGSLSSTPTMFSRGPRSRSQLRHWL
jgi:hypothetical protein